jgi:tetratricopeptide (TPR) repeat protein
LEGAAMADDETVIGEDTDKHFGIWYNNQVWALLAKRHRTASEDDLMIHAAHASHLHWLHAGTALHRQRGFWLLAHVYAELGLGERAVYYAEECAAVAKEYTKIMRDFDRSYTSEALARAYAVAGRLDDAHEHFQEAQRSGTEIGDDGDREIFMSDLTTGNWGDFVPPAGA